MKTETKELNSQHASLGVLSSKGVPLLERITILLEKVVYAINNVTHKIASVLLFLLMILTTADVFGRYVFNKPITGVYEVTGLILAVIIFFSLGMTQIKKDHIEIDFLTNKFSERVQEILKASTSLIMFILLLLTTWQLFEYTKRVYEGGELSGDLGVPIYLFTGVTIIGVFFFSLAVFTDMLKSLLKVVRKNEF